MHELFSHRLNFAELLPSEEVVVTWNITRGNELVLLTVPEEDWNRPPERGGPFSRTRPDKPYDGTLWRLTDQGVVYSLDIPCALGVHIQGLPDGRFLLVRARCRKVDDLNAEVIGFAGEVESRFKVGDAVEDVQVGGDDSVWVSYFDEGTFYNDGWKEIWTGLAEFNLEGELKYRHPFGICDCYSLNVGKSDVYACYHSDFPVLKLSLKDKVETLWQNDFRRGCRALAVWGDTALLAGGYADEFALASLVSLGREETSLLQEFSLERPQEFRLLTGRGPILHYLNWKDWWTLDIRELL